MDTKRIDVDVQTYDSDCYGWTQQQAVHLRSGRIDLEARHLTFREVSCRDAAGARASRGAIQATPRRSPTRQ